MKKCYIAERLTLLSAIARSMDDEKRHCGLWYDEREPRRHMTMQPIVPYKKASRSACICRQLRYAFH